MHVKAYIYVANLYVYKSEIL